MKKVKINKINVRTYPDRFIKVTGFDQKNDSYCFFFPLELGTELHKKANSSLEVVSSEDFEWDISHNNWKNKFGSKLTIINEPTHDKNIGLKSSPKCPFCKSEFQPKHYKYNDFTKRHLLKCASCDGEFIFKRKKSVGATIVLLDPTTIKRGINPIQRSKLEKIQRSLKRNGLKVKGMIQEASKECPNCKKSLEYDHIQSDTHYECSCKLRIEFKKFLLKDGDILCEEVTKITSQKQASSKSAWLEACTEKLKNGLLIHRPTVPRNLPDLTRRFFDRMPNHNESLIYEQIQERLNRLTPNVLENDDNAWYTIAKFFAENGNDRDREIFADMEGIVGLGERNIFRTVHQLLGTIQGRIRQEREEQERRVQRNQVFNQAQPRVIGKKEIPRERYKGELLTKEELKKFDPYDIQEFSVVEGPTGKNWVKRVLLEIRELDKLVELHKKQKKGTFIIKEAKFDINNDRVVKVKCTLKMGKKDQDVEFLIRLHRNYPREPPKASDFSIPSLLNTKRFVSSGKGWDESHLQGFRNACMGKVDNKWDKTGKMGVAHYLKMVGVYISVKEYKVKIKEYRK